MTARARLPLVLALGAATLAAAVAPTPAPAQVMAETAAEKAAHGPLWLDDTYSKRALGWVAKERARTLKTLKADRRFAALQKDAETVLTDASRLHEVDLMAGAAYEYWQDREHPLGLWRRTSVEAYFAGAPVWETVIDVDALGKAEGRKWIFAGASCRGRRCLVRMSDNGKDAAFVREFDLDTKTFVEGGFQIPESKSRAWWYDDDTLLVAPVLGPETVNESGFPKTLRLWDRGAPMAATKPLFEIGDRDGSLSASLLQAAGVKGFVAARHLDFNSREYSLVLEDGSRTPLPLPKLADFTGMHEGRLLLRLNAPWTPAGTTTQLPSGALVAVPLEPLLKQQRVDQAEALYSPSPEVGVRQVIADGQKLFLALSRNYRTAVVELSRDPAGVWRTREVPVESDRFIQLLGVRDGRLLLKVESPITPEKLVLADPQTGAATTLYERAPAFDAAGLKAELFETRSRDGTPIAYTVIQAADIKVDGTNPTLVYGYGGYDVGVTPRYEPVFGKLWVERGGVYVHAYLRGGGEKGPDWHRGAMRKNRQQPYDDMAAVLEDLQRRKITSPAHTGIMGRSNGGLMVATVMEQRPELMNAVVVGGPLIDMLNFHELPPGASWTAEYGDPRDPDMRAFLQTYSPMQNLRKDANYPVPLIITSTDDDRVLPGHARRFSARMSEMGHDNLYFEDQQGGHYWELAGGPAPGDWRLRAIARAVEFTYLWRQLGGSAK